ncbi:MAG: hypothetical protein NTY55_12095 [Flavobacteriia bacterium]|nr:hypothetical protein [Flavobacteriia bacterium]
MSADKNNLNKLIDFVIELSQLNGNDWFKKKLENHFSNIKKNDCKSDSNIAAEIKQDTSKIIHFLEINPSCSVDYSFIEHKLLRTRLELDNLRMENVRYDLKEKDEMKRLYDFCINAFYQVENLLNFYYYEKFPNIEDLLPHLESIEGTSFRRKDEKNIGDITIATKIYSFTRTYYASSEKFIGMNIDSLRLIRNEGLHRCTRIKNVENENKRLHQFIKYATFDSVHAIVYSLSIKVKKLLNK